MDHYPVQELETARRELAVERKQREAAEQTAKQLRETLKEKLAKLEMVEKSGATGTGTGTNAGREPLSAARLQAIPDEIAAAFQAKDGKRALALLAELRSAGRAGWPLAAKLMTDIQESFNAGNPLAISQNDFYKLAAGYGELHADAIQNPQSYDKGFRMFAAYSLPWSDLPNVNDIFINDLTHEQDAAVARVIASQLAERPDPANVAALLSALQQQQNPQVRLAIARDLAGIPGGDAQHALQSIVATETDPEVKKAAELGLESRQTQVAGFFITYVAPNSQAEAVGIKEGDILVTYKGAPITSMDQLDQAKATVQPEEVVDLGIRRGERAVAIQVKGGNIGINGRFVQPEGR